jgi:uncharacterized radical SAM protein YgiQ
LFIPTTKEEINKLNWDQLDVILISGDTYIDSPQMGIAIIGQLLIKHGFRVGIIAQPDCQSDNDITRLGEPRLFWGVSGGCVDSMVSNYTASKKKRKADDLTPGGTNNRRPDRALIAYSNLIRRYFKNTVPIVLGGIEASLRRMAHYDFWSNKIRRSILFDAKADVLVYGMGEKAVMELVHAFKKKQDINEIKGICYISKEKNESYIDIGAFEQVEKDKQAFIAMFHQFYQNNDPDHADGLYQQYGDRFLIQNPPSPRMTAAELYSIYHLPYERNIHPYYKAMGPVKALHTIQFSITTHRGCYGECSFCAIAVHQGRNIVSRSQKSILQEARSFVDHSDFKRIITNIGGATANMYQSSCLVKNNHTRCKNKKCLYPSACKNLDFGHRQQIHLLQALRKIKGIRKVFIGSGIRYDLILNDLENGKPYLEEIIQHHISGQMKIAPEHSQKQVLKLMGKPPADRLTEFKKQFDNLNKKYQKKQFLTYYFIAAHPGCTQEDMLALKKYITSQLKLHPEQIQVFTPTPSTYSTLMYYTGEDPFTHKQIFVENDLNRMEKQKKAVTNG